MLGRDLGVTGRDLAAESMFEYGARVGFWRLHRIFTRFGLPVTIFGCAKAFEANPPAYTMLRIIKTPEYGQYLPQFESKTQVVLT